MNMAEVDAPFQSAHAALVFAFNFSHAQFPQSTMARLLAGPPLGNGKGLGGLDGAGQAGMVLAEVMALRGEPLFMQEAPLILAARFSPHDDECVCGSPCCSGRKPSPSWSAAVEELAVAAIIKLEGTAAQLRLRRALIARYFGQRTSLSDLAYVLRVNKNTVTEHNSKVVGWLRHEEGRAMYALDAALRSKGMVDGGAVQTRASAAA